jgi:hypothetical protein
MFRKALVGLSCHHGTQQLKPLVEEAIGQTSLAAGDSGLSHEIKADYLGMPRSAYTTPHQSLPATVLPGDASSCCHSSLVACGMQRAAGMLRNKCDTCVRHGLRQRAPPCPGCIRTAQ